MTHSLFEMLGMTRLTAVVDIGASPIDGEPPYQSMLEQGLCTVVGFEPQNEALAKLNQDKGPLETYLPHAIGPGHHKILRFCECPGMTSFLNPDERSLGVFPGFDRLGTVIGKDYIPTRALDSIDEIKELDFLKMDVQGSELMVLLSGKKKLAQAVAIQLEVSFVPLYENQPPLGILDLHLRDMGFLPHHFAEIKRWAIAPGNPCKPGNQLLEADLVYVKDFRKPELFNDEQLRHLAMIAHYCYRSFDLTAWCLSVLEARGSIRKYQTHSYLTMMQC